MLKRNYLVLLSILNSNLKKRITDIFNKAGQKNTCSVQNYKLQCLWIKRNIQTLATEIYKQIHGLPPAIMGEVFKINRTLPYNLRPQNDFSSRVPKTVKYGTETISFLAPKVWALVPEKMKECSCLESFKSKNRKWKPDCPCRLCKTYLQHVGFL